MSAFVQDTRGNYKDEFVQLKGILQPKMEMVSLFTQPHVLPKPEIEFLKNFKDSFLCE